MALIGKMNYLEIKGNTYEIEDKNAAPIDSPAFTGTPTAPTPGTEAGDTEIATVKYVTDAMAGAGAGTVTSVGVSNKTNGGLSVTGSPITGSGTISIGHSNVLTSAQTTQAVYPIKIDKNGHISAYGSAVTIPTVPDETGNSGTGITIADHATASLTGVSGSSTVRGVKTGTNSTTTASKASGSNGTPPTLGTVISIYGVKSGTNSTTTASKVTLGTASSIYGVSSSTTSVTGVQSSTTTASKASGSNGTAPTLGDPIPVVAATDVTVPIKNASATSIPNVTNAGSASTWVFEDVTVPIRNTSATSIPNVTAVGSGTFTQGTFTGGSFTQGEDEFTANVPTKIDTSKFNAGSYSHTGFSGGSGSFTQGTFSGGSGSFSASVSNHVLSFSHTHTAATHGADSHTHTAATYGTDSFTAPSLGTGFYTVGTAASFTQGEDEFTPATHGADSHTHTPPTLGTAISIYGVQSGTNSTKTASHVKSGGNGTAPTLGTAISIIGVQSSTTTASKVTVTDSETDFGVTDVGTPSSWSFTNVTVPIKNTSATTVPIKNTSSTSVPSISVTDVTVPIRADEATSIPNVTDVGTASTWSFTDVTVPIRADADTTVPTANSTATTVVTGKTHTITDNGHTHSI